MTTTAKNEAQELAKSLGAEIEVSEFNSYDQSWTIEALAPEGKEWVDNGATSLVEIAYSYAKGSRDEAYKNLIERMKLGLQEDKTEA